MQNCFGGQESRSENQKILIIGGLIIEFPLRFILIHADQLQAKMYRLTGHSAIIGD